MLSGNQTFGGEQFEGKDIGEVGAGLASALAAKPPRAVMFPILLAAFVFILVLLAVLLTSDLRDAAVSLASFLEARSTSSAAIGSIGLTLLVGLAVAAFQLHPRKARNRLAITELKSARALVEHLAYHDGLTGLPNRLSLQGRLAQSLNTARREGHCAAVILIDMDRFKAVNETFGHTVGDKLLVEVSRRLRTIVRNSDVVARLGGDEFVVVLTDLKTPDMAGRHVDRIMRELRETHLLGGNQFAFTPSVGISVFPEDGETPEDLMKNADAAMYHAKSDGRNTYQYFATNMNRDAAARLMLETQLRHAVERNEFFLHYQPQFDLATGQPIGFEALVRWRHPKEGVIAPGRFIPVAEESGLIVEVGRWVLREAMRQLRAWRDAGHIGGRLAVNVSLHQLRARDFVAEVANALSDHGIEASALEIEITESVAMHNPEATIEILNGLRAMGVELAIDDFGTGYSSLSYLKLLPIQRLKLDQSFVRDIETDPNDAAICRATIALSHSLNLEVVAEGVETEAQLALLQGLGCDLAQGYFFSKPVPAREASTFLAVAA